MIPVLLFALAPTGHAAEPTELEVAVVNSDTMVTPSTPKIRITTIR